MSKTHKNPARAIAQLSAETAQRILLGDGLPQPVQFRCGAIAYEAQMITIKGKNAQNEAVSKRFLTIAKMRGGDGQQASHANAIAAVAGLLETALIAVAGMILRLDGASRTNELHEHLILLGFREGTTPKEDADIYVYWFVQ